MLSELRRALADTVSGAMPEARILAFPPLVLNMPASGVFGFVEPAEPYVQTWLTMSNGGRGVVRLNLHLFVSDTQNPERDYDRLDALIDPLSDAANVFAAIVNNRDLDVTGFEAQATPLLEDVAAPQLQSVGPVENQVTAYELILPVQVIVQRS